MITIESFVFNPFQENTFLLYDETKECIIIDAGIKPKLLLRLVKKELIYIIAKIDKKLIPTIKGIA